MEKECGRAEISRMWLDGYFEFVPFSGQAGARECAKKAKISESVVG